MLSLSSLYGQWYARDYLVPDINFLTKEQLEISLSDCNWDLLKSAGVAGCGAAFFLVSKYGDNSVGDDASFFEQLIGEKGKKGVGIITGAGMFAGGTVACIVFAVRRGNINSALRLKNQYTGSISFAPAVIVTRSARFVNPGLSLTYKF
jgi:hypothetical protein